MRRGRKTSNLDLPDLPDDSAFLRAVAYLELSDGERREPNVTAQRIARRLGVQGARRHGRGAVQHSWTGTMAPALRISPRLRSLVKRGFLWRTWDTEGYRSVYGLTQAGRDML